MSTDRHRVEVLAEEFADRLRLGETPSIEEYVTAHPDLAEEIQGLFPTIAALEGMRRRQERPSDGRASIGPAKLQRLGDFRILRELGRGGMGVVYEAEQESLERRVAVKVLPKQSLLDDKHLRRFQREARTAARLHHTNIVPILAVGVHDGYHYYAMQMIDGVSLDEIISRIAERDDADVSGQRISEFWRQASDIRRGGGPAAPGGPAETVGLAPPAEASNPSQQTTPAAAAATPQDSSGFTFVSGGSGASTAEAGRLAPPQPRGSTYWHDVAEIGVQAASALDYAHQHGVLHRDVKPGNLILDGSGTVWVADFGLAKATEQEQVSRTGDIVGTLRFMAPEQLRGEADSRSDIYALGVTLYELLTLQPAHQESSRKQALVGGLPGSAVVSPRRVNPTIPRDLETIILKAIAEEPAQRYATAAEMAEDLQCFLEDRPIMARRAGPAERVQRWARRNPAVAALASLAAALLLMVAIVASVGYIHTTGALSRESQQRQRAESALSVSLEALDRVYKRFAPDRVLVASSVEVGDSDSAGGTVELPAQPLLSQETAALLQDLLASYDRLAELDSDNVALQAEAAKANRRLGDIYQRLSQNDDALKAYRRAADKYRKLAGAAAAAEDIVKFQTETARIENELGGIYTRLRDTGRAFRAHRTALDQLLALAPQTDDTGVRFELARTHYLLSGATFGGPVFGGPRRGGPRRGGRDAEAARRDDGGGDDSGRGEAEDARQEGPPRGPGGPRGEPGRGFGPGRPGEPPGAGPPPRPPGPPPLAQGRPPGVSSARLREHLLRGMMTPRPLNQQQREHLAEAVSLLTALQQENPGVPEYPRMLALCYREQSRDGDGEAMAKATSLLQKVVSQYPEVDDYRYDLAMTLAASGSSPAEAERDLLAAVKQARRLDALVPAYATARAELCSRLAGALWIRGEELDDPQRRREAESYLAESVQLYEKLVEGYPQSPSYRGRTAISLEIQAGMVASQQTPDAWRRADSLLTDATAHLRAVIESHPDTPFTSMLHWSLHNIYEQKARLLTKLDDEPSAAVAAAAAESHKETARASWRDRRRPWRGRGERNDRGGPRDGAERNAPQRRPGVES